MQTKAIPVPGEFIKYQHIERLGTDNEEIKGLYPEVFKKDDKK